MDAKVIENLLFDYIENEKNYIKNDIDVAKNKYHADTLGLEQDLFFLNDLTIEDCEQIAMNIADDEEVQKVLQYALNYYTYHYKRNTKEVK